MISLRGINRSFGDHQVLHDVSFDVVPGRMTGFVGANGSGKTTTMRIVLGVLAPHSGTVEVDGEPITGGYRSRIGYMPEERGLYPKMSVIDQLVYLGELHGLTAADARRRGTDLLERLGLAERAGDHVEALSLGNQQRAQIAAALVHDPVALILDEPFSGLDPMAVETTLGVLRDVADAGAPVLFSSHQLDVVERLCDDLVIIADGRVRASGGREEIRARHSSPEWTLVTAGDTGWVRGVPGVDVIEFDGGHVRFAASSPELADRVLREAVERGSVISFGPYHRPLTEIFAEVVR
ncbi:MAG TPA: ATP-binding cassette domain-containing protein [Actinotalea caeni]|uniref:ABC transporter ATP-binding protein n=1 Tax=Actinotalea caeni TaxID=1348467 RepID=UPI0012E24398|nr:ATP-binding cassette domain-containing protein [Actinotalea caeni]HLV54979.1 ATP-binding cassette domain-containing protein [Actinotalea caeni]